MNARHAIPRSGGDFDFTFAWLLTRLTLGPLALTLLVGATWPH